MFSLANTVTGMAMTSMSVTMVRMNVDIAKAPALMVYVGVMLKSQYAAIGKVWNMTTRKVATMAPTVMKIMTCEGHVRQLENSEDTQSRIMDPGAYKYRPPHVSDMTGYSEHEQQGRCLHQSQGGIVQKALYPSPQ